MSIQEDAVTNPVDYESCGTPTRLLKVDETIVRKSGASSCASLRTLDDPEKCETKLCEKGARR